MLGSELRAPANAGVHLCEVANAQLDEGICCYMALTLMIAKLLSVFA